MGGLGGGGFVFRLGPREPPPPPPPPTHSIQSPSFSKPHLSIVRLFHLFPSHLFPPFSLCFILFTQRRALKVIILYMCSDPEMSLLCVRDVHHKATVPSCYHTYLMQKGSHFYSLYYSSFCSLLVLSHSRTL